MNKPEVNEPSRSRVPQKPVLDKETQIDSSIGSTISLEELAEVVKAQASDAAEALRQGKFIESAETDLTANSDDRLIALLCYWTQIVMPLVMPIIVLLSESSKRRPFQRHHAMQSLGLTGAIIGLLVVTSLIIPFIGFVVGLLALLCLAPIAYIMIVTAYVFYGWQAHKGKRFSIPILSRFLRNQGWMD